ncbi:MAG: twin-arginine translocase TatA/TatE family subunit [Deltaproteobacteria bacterium]|nr:twin-arginine translocase TatA/TatE family subunit [Deltaproteobacteria bacterium]
MPGMGELVIILLIVLVVFGASKLPQIGDALGRSIKNFKRATKVDDDDKDDELEAKDAKQLAVGTQQKQIEKGTGADDAEWEEVVVRRRKKSADS